MRANKAEEEISLMPAAGRAAAGVLRPVLSGERACWGPKHLTGQAANRARTRTGTETETETLSELPGCGSELLFLSAFIIESRNDKCFWPWPATTTYRGEPGAYTASRDVKIRASMLILTKKDLGWAEPFCHRQGHWANVSGLWVRL